MIPAPAGSLVAGPAGPIDCLVTGRGGPTTVFVHGLAGSIAQTRPFGSGVLGTRVFMHLRGHGATAAPRDASGDPVPGGYPEAAGDVAAVIAATGATRAVGLSFGAAALVALIAAGQRPERLVLLLPPRSSTDRTDPPEELAESGAVRAGFTAMAAALDAGDVEALARALRAHQPEAVRRTPAVLLWARRHAADLVAGREGGLAAALRVWPRLPVPEPVPDAAGPEVLVIGQQGDPVHPAQVAARWALLLGADLEVLPTGGLPWSARQRVRDLIGGHLNG